MLLPGQVISLADSLLILTVLSHSLVSRSSYLTACKDEMLNRMQHVEGRMLMPSYTQGKCQDC